MLFIFQLIMAMVLVLRVFNEEAAYHLWNGNWFWLAKAMYLMLIVVYAPEIISLAQSRVNWVRWLQGKRPIKRREEWPEIDWLPVYELVDFMIKHQWLPVTELKTYFGKFTNDNCKKLWDNLERVGILGRWANNSRILAIQDADIIAAMLKKAEGDSSNVIPALLQTWPAEFTTTTSLSKSL